MRWTKIKRGFYSLITAGGIPVGIVERGEVTGFWYALCYRHGREEVLGRHVTFEEAKAAVVDSLREPLAGT